MCIPHVYGMHGCSTQRAKFHEIIYTHQASKGFELLLIDFLLAADKLGTIYPYPRPRRAHGGGGGGGGGVGGGSGGGDGGSSGLRLAETVLHTDQSLDAFLQMTDEVEASAARTAPTAPRAHVSNMHPMHVYTCASTAPTAPRALSARWAAALTPLR